MRKIFYLLLLLFTLTAGAIEKVELGVDVFFASDGPIKLKDKKVALFINQTSVNRDLKSTCNLFLENAINYKITKIFTPEHGLNGSHYSGENVDNSKSQNVEVLSLHGKHKRPTKDMLKDIDVIICDIQEIGCRSYTYATTLFYIMEEAAKNNIDVIILDRPNPMNGIVCDGPMLDDEFRSFLGYVNVPYCHGMTIGELSLYFNSEYKTNCKLEVVSMKGWKREMTFKDTELNWIPTSPNIPEADTAVFYATTGILGEIELVSIGIGYTLPFKIIGAPWIDGEKFCKSLNSQNLAGVKFIPFYFKPFYGTYKNKNCQGVKILITDKLKYRPSACGYLILGMLKSLYPKIVKDKLKGLSEEKILTFCKVNGNKEIYNFLINEQYPAWKMIEFQADKVKEFQNIKKKYLLY